MGAYFTSFDCCPFLGSIILLRPLPPHCILHSLLKHSCQFLAPWCRCAEEDKDLLVNQAACGISGSLLQSKSAQVFVSWNQKFKLNILPVVCSQFSAQFEGDSIKEIFIGKSSHVVGAVTSTSLNKYLFDKSKFVSYFSISFLNFIPKDWTGFWLLGPQIHNSFFAKKNRKGRGGYPPYGQNPQSSIWPSP